MASQEDKLRRRIKENNAGTAKTKTAKPVAKKAASKKAASKKANK